MTEGGSLVKTRPSKQCEFCIDLDESFDQSGVSELFDWSGSGFIKDMVFML